MHFFFFFCNFHQKIVYEFQYDSQIFDDDNIQMEFSCMVDGYSCYCYYFFANIQLQADLII